VSLFTARTGVRRGGSSVGARGERYAAAYVRDVGMKVVCTNWSCRVGEIDLVALDGSELVIVEVKTRNDGPMAERYLFASLTDSKKRKLRLLADFFLMERFGARRRPPVRIDAIGVILGKDSSLRMVRHLKGVV
jgi:putative endonuclease